MPAGTGEQRHLRRFTILYIKKQSVHYRILRSYKDTLHGRSGETRTRGLLLPKQARYQLRNTPESGGTTAPPKYSISFFVQFVNTKSSVEGAEAFADDLAGVDDGDKAVGVVLPQEVAQL